MHHFKIFYPKLQPIIIALDSFVKLCMAKLLLIIN